MYSVRTSAKFRQDVKRCKKQRKNMELFKAINESLILGKKLPKKNKDHVLVGNWKGHQECHIGPDWLLIYLICENKKEIEYVRMGSHAELFGK